jgi:hypothetical protein
MSICKVENFHGSHEKRWEGEGEARGKRGEGKGSGNEGKGKGKQASQVLVNERLQPYIFLTLTSLSASQLACWIRAFSYSIGQSVLWIHHSGLDNGFG